MATKKTVTERKTIKKSQIQGKCIGMDFGTTYSVIAEVEQRSDGSAETVAVPIIDEATEAKGGVFYDSLVLRYEGKEGKDALRYGHEAHEEMGTAGTVSYRGFKVLLAENRDSVRESEGYTSEWTPEKISEGYLKDLLGSYKNKAENKGIDISKLVVGVPYVWSTDIDDTAYRSLLDILNKIGVASEIEYLSEPEAACGYFVENYRKYNKGKAYEGHVLLVDYGGGTLDITLCKVADNNDIPDIKVIGKTGAGANTDHRIGEAGLAFMREVICLVLEKNGKAEEDIELIKSIGKLDKAAFSLELKLKRFGMTNNGVKSDDYDFFEERFEDLDEDILNELTENENPLGDIEILIDVPVRVNERILWDQERFPITLGIIAQAYKNTIYYVLDEKLDEIDKEIKKNGIKTSAGAKQLKIQLIGGFCNFFPVEQQVLSHFGTSAKADKKEDYRFKGTIEKGDKRLLAVAYGAALKANNMTEYTRTFKYSIGVHGVQESYWAAEKNDDLIPGRVYLFKDKKGAIPCGVDNIKQLAYIGAYGNEPKTQKLSEDYVKVLKFDIDRMEGYLMGVSLDEHGIITFHWWEITNTTDFDKDRDGFEDMLYENKRIKQIEGGKYGKCLMGKLLALDKRLEIKNLM